MKTRKYLLWGLTIGWMAVIFCFSAQSGAASAESSSRLADWIVRHALENFNQMKEEMQQAALLAASYGVRKLAHLMEYAVLGALLSLLLRCYFRGTWQHSLLALPCAALYAGTDELHQLFVAERSGQWMDVGIDTLGALAGIAAVFVCLILAADWSASGGTAR